MPWLEIDTRAGTASSTTVTGGLGFHGALLVPLALAVAAIAYFFMKRRTGLGVRVTILGLAVAIAFVISLGFRQADVSFSMASHAFGPDLLPQSGVKMGAYLAMVATLAIALGAVFWLGYQPGVDSDRPLWTQKHDST